jgi:hypothetical protein
VDWRKTTVGEREETKREAYIADPESSSSAGGDTELVPLSKEQWREVQRLWDSVRAQRLAAGRPTKPEKTPAKTEKADMKNAKPVQSSVQQDDRRNEPPLDAPALNPADSEEQAESTLSLDPGRIIVVSASDLLETPTSEPDQIVTDVLDRGDKGAIIASSKMKKSFFSLQLAMSLAAGRDCLGWSVPKPRRVLYVQFEIQKHHFHRRVCHMAAGLGLTTADLDDRLQIINARGLGLCGPTGIERLSAAIKPLEPDVICLDPLYKLLDGKENAAEDVKVTLNQIDGMAEETGAAIVYVHHDAKGSSGDRDIRDRGAGSNVLGRDYDVGITLTPHASEPDAVVIDALLRNYRPQDPFTIEWTEDAVSESYCFVLRRDIAPTKQTSATARKQNVASFETYLPVALEMVKNEPLNITAFKDALKLKTGLTRDRTSEFTNWALSHLDTPLDVHEVRGAGMHGKWIGTPEQIAKLRRNPDT